MHGLRKHKQLKTIHPVALCLRFFTVTLL